MSALDEMIRTLTDRADKVFHLRRARAEVVAGDDTGLVRDFDGSLRIGGSHLADLTLTDRTISSLHCLVELGDRIRLRDLDSKNGTFLGPYQVNDAFVAPGEVITIGRSHIRIAPLPDQEIMLGSHNRLHGLVGASPIMRNLIRQIEAAAPTEATILITGETGTGKERVAEAVHLCSQRSGPLVVVDCGALPGTLATSELFGHERGAFTGADARRIGAFERAHRGTIFLDEIGELPLEVQPMLLRALQSRQIRRVGGEQMIDLDVRIVAATHRDLALEVSRKRFREDLFYRLAVVTLHVPALRERLLDLPLLGVGLLEEIGVTPASVLTPDALAELAAYDWPGNVRELRNVLERGVLEVGPLVPQRRTPPAPNEAAGPDLGLPLLETRRRAVDAAERRYLSALIRACKGNIAMVARRAGTDRMTIYRALQRLQLYDAAADEG